jgi:hypothetical protein
LIFATATPIRGTVFLQGENRSMQAMSPVKSIKIIVRVKRRNLSDAHYITFMKTHLASQVDSHSNHGTDSSVHSLRVTAASEDGDAMSLATTAGDKFLNFFSHSENSETK